MCTCIYTCSKENFYIGLYSHAYVRVLWIQLFPMFPHYNSIYVYTSTETLLVTIYMYIEVSVLGRVECV